MNIGQPQDEWAKQRLRWQEQRRTDMRLLKFFTLMALVCGISMWAFPAWLLWFLIAGIVLVTLGTLLDSLWLGPRQIRRLREIRLSPNESLGDLYQSAANSEFGAETAE